MLQQQTAKDLMAYVNDVAFCKAYKAYIEDLIKTKITEIKNYAYGDNSVHRCLAQLKLLEILKEMPELVRGNLKNGS